MNSQQPQPWSRREFLGHLTGAATAGLVGLHPQPAGAAPPPETTTIRMARQVTMCEAPQAMAEELLRAEGFTDVRYVGGFLPLERRAAVRRRRDRFQHEVFRSPAPPPR